MTDEVPSLVVLRHEADRYYLVPRSGLDRFGLMEKQAAALAELLELDEVRVHIIAPNHVGESAAEIAALGVLPAEFAAKLPDDLLGALADGEDAGFKEVDGDGLVLLDAEKRLYLLPHAVLDRFELRDDQRGALEELLTLDDVRVHIIAPESPAEDRAGLTIQVLGTLPEEFAKKLSA